MVPDVDVYGRSSATSGYGSTVGEASSEQSCTDDTPEHWIRADSLLRMGGIQCTTLVVSQYLLHTRNKTTLPRGRRRGLQFAMRIVSVSTFRSEAACTEQNDSTATLTCFLLRSRDSGQVCHSCCRHVGTSAVHCFTDFFDKEEEQDVKVTLLK